MDNLGFSTLEANQKLQEYGFNDVEEKKAGVFKKFLVFIISPISLMLLGAAFLSLFSHKLFDFYFILVLFFMNFIVQRWQEFKADKALEQLRSKLAFDVITLRDGKWQPINSKYLVPGDRIRLGLGSIIPADATVVFARNLTVNEAVLTGESLPKDKKIGDKIFSGAYITTGNLEAEVTATGKNTSFGKTIFSIEPSLQRSILEQDILNISHFLMIISFSAVFILTVFLLLKGSSLKELLTLDLSLIIACIPIALPAVMTIILSIGSLELAKRLVIVRRLSALEDLANVNMLLTDKTGTLTKNQIQVVDVVPYRKLTKENVLEFAFYGASSDTPDTIDKAILRKVQIDNLTKFSGKILDFIPFDSDRKRATVTVQKDKTKFLVSLGAPQIIKGLVDFDTKTAKAFDGDIDKATADGYRTMAIAFKEDSDKEEGMKMVGLLLLADPLDKSARDTIRFMKAKGIDVKMLTGDNEVIAERAIKELGMTGTVLSHTETEKLYGRSFSAEDFDKIAAFAEILPKDKYEIVQYCKNHYITAVTGDGINDFPALKAAYVGIAVKNAVSALKSMADIVLLGHSIDVIKDAVLEARKIFARLYNYSVYRISESFRVVITILIIGLWRGVYPLIPLQLILLALLNDIPIISLAVDRVKISRRPVEIQAKQRLALSLMFGTVGILQSIILFLLMLKVFHLPWPVIQTMFFLKLTVSGHSLIFIAHTKERWYRYLPSKAVMIAIFTTQGIATTLALTGALMPHAITLGQAGFVWLWALGWMQVAELMKIIHSKIFKIKVQ
jgi:H+-transporting ATPase